MSKRVEKWLMVGVLAVLGVGILMAGRASAATKWYGATSTSAGGDYCYEMSGSGGASTMDACCNELVETKYKELSEAARRGKKTACVTNSENWAAAKAGSTTTTNNTPQGTSTTVSSGSCDDDKCVKTNLIYNRKEDSSGTTCYCGDNKGEAIQGILMKVVNIISGLVGALAVVGLLVAGFQYLTARDNEAQVVKAKMRIFQIVIGLVVFVLMWAFLNWLVPGGVFK